MIASLVFGIALAQQLPAIFQPQETILFQGDSITDGNRGRSADPNHILGHGYQFDIASRYGSAYPGLGLRFLNRGVSGNTLEKLGARWQADTIDLKPDVLSILVGINDIYFAHGRHEPLDVDGSFARYDELLRRATSARPGLKLILCQPFALEVGMVKTDTAAWRSDVQKMGEVVVRLGEKYHAPVVNFQQVFNEALKLAPAEHWIWDGIHPTYSGHGLMADAWIRAYNDFYVSPLRDSTRNSAIRAEVNFERDSYDWLHRHAEVLDLQARNAFDVVMVGDSITHFWAGEPKSDRVSGADAWGETFKGLKVLNMGCGWDRTQNVLWRLGHGELAGQHPKTIVLNIGTNNLVGDRTARTNSLAETAAGIEAVVDEIHRVTPDTRVVVMAVFPRGFEKGNELDRRIGQLNALLAVSIGRRPFATFLDIGSKLREPDGSITREMFFDGTHPTAKGYAIWGAALRDGGFLR